MQYRIGTAFFLFLG